MLNSSDLAGWPNITVLGHVVPVGNPVFCLIPPWPDSSWSTALGDVMSLSGQFAESVMEVAGLSGLIVCQSSFQSAFPKYGSCSTRFEAVSTTAVLSLLNCLVYSCTHTGVPNASPEKVCCMHCPIWLCMYLCVCCMID